jgi:hypothetical protein
MGWAQAGLQMLNFRLLRAVRHKEVQAEARCWKVQMGGLCDPTSVGKQTPAQGGRDRAWVSYMPHAWKLWKQTKGSR